MKTFSLKTADIKRQWHVFDAKGQTLGRIASQIAGLLMGKTKSGFSRHLDMGDQVVVINAGEVSVTGRKENQKEYYRHSGYPGGFKITSLAQLRQTHPDRIILHAVSGMLPKNKLHDRMLKHLHIFSGPEHPYKSQFKNLG